MINRVLITGASGFIARNLATRLQHTGIETIGISSRVHTVSGFNRIHNARLGDSITSVLEREDVDVVVHCALKTGKDSYETN